MLLCADMQALINPVHTNTQHDAAVAAELYDILSTLT